MKNMLQSASQWQPQAQQRTVSSCSNFLLFCEPKSNRRCEDVCANSMRPSVLKAHNHTDPATAGLHWIHWAMLGRQVSRKVNGVAPSCMIKATWKHHGHISKAWALEDQTHLWQLHPLRDLESSGATRRCTRIRHARGSVQHTSPVHTNSGSVQLSFQVRAVAPCELERCLQGATTTMLGNSWSTTAVSLTVRVRRLLLGSHNEGKWLMMACIEWASGCEQVDCSLPFLSLFYTADPMKTPNTRTSCHCLMCIVNELCYSVFVLPHSRSHIDVWFVTTITFC